MAVGDLYQVQVFYNIGSEVTMNVVHLKETVASTDDIPAKTVAKVMHVRWAQLYGNINWSDETRVSAFQVRRIKPTTGVPYLAILGTAEFATIEGTAPGAPVPSMASVLVSLYTNTLTKSGRGRIYLPGLQGAAQNDGQLLEAPLTDISADAATLEDTQVAVGPETGEWDFHVFSRKNQTSAKVTTVTVHSNMATQRGRRNFAGVGQ
jgi:hypothetical protein